MCDPSALAQLRIPEGRLSPASRGEELSCSVGLT